ncbi:MAG: carboxypeptidase regulatory-like domain-containing protein [Elusimicrobia bacterium]|nr:carboxypeptidase regulatory-like domain-containing protein [Elusimicrobiota bacterium]
MKRRALPVLWFVLGCLFAAPAFGQGEQSAPAEVPQRRALSRLAPSDELRGPAVPQRGAPSRLAGRVQAKPKVAVHGDSAGAYKSRSLKYAKLFDYGHLKNVVVFAESAAPAVSGDAPSLPVSTTSGEGFSITFEMTRGSVGVKPGFLAAPAASPVAFKNLTQDSLTVYSGGGAPKSFMVTIDPGGQKEVFLDALGFYPVFCLEYPRAQTSIFAASPYFSGIDAEGRYAFDLPAGKYRVTAWHERLPSRSLEVELDAGEARQLDFTLSVEELPEIQ